MNDSSILSRGGFRRFAVVAVLAALAVPSSRYFRPAWAVQGQDAARQRSPDRQHSTDQAAGESGGGQATGEGVAEGPVANDPEPHAPGPHDRGGLRLPEYLDEIPADSDSRPGSPQALERIRSRLRGEGPRSPTGDGTLDDILRLIDGQGSILDGSSLELPKRPAAASPDATASARRRARAAEALLRAARLLERERRLERESGPWHDGQDPPDGLSADGLSADGLSADGPPAADDLVKQMRAEAARLLGRPADRQRRSGIDPSFEKHPSDEPF